MRASTPGDGLGRMGGSSGRSKKLGDDELRAHPLAGRFAGLFGLILVAALALPGLAPRAVSGLSLGVSAVSPNAGQQPAVAQRGQALGQLSEILGSDSSMGTNPGSLVPLSRFQASGTSRENASTTPNVCAHAPNYGWLHTSGVWIVDDKGCKVRLASVTWYGMQTDYFVPAGLDILPYFEIMQRIKALGFNSIRVPLSDELVKDNARITITQHIGEQGKTNWNTFHGQHPLTILDTIVQTAHQLGLLIILDNHSSSATIPGTYGKKASVGPKGIRTDEATWHTKQYPSSQWIKDWLLLTHRYLKDPTVIGFDIRNEPHTDGPGPWSLKTYLTQGATWGKYPSKKWKKSSNWPAAAEKCGNAIQKVNPHLLLFVEGVQLYPDKTQPRGVESYWWGAILRGVATDPIKFHVPHQLVYSPHEWGPWKCCLTAFNMTIKGNPLKAKDPYAAMSKIWNANWGFILQSNKATIQAPIWIGEFNTCSGKPKCVSNTKKGSQGEWWQLFIKYLQLHPEIGWAFWAVNGTNSYNQPANNGILDRSWTNPSLPGMMKSLQTIETQPR